MEESDREAEGYQTSDLLIALSKTKTNIKGIGKFL